MDKVTYVQLPEDPTRVHQGWKIALIILLVIIAIDFIIKSVYIYSYFNSCPPAERSTKGFQRYLIENHI